MFRRIVLGFVSATALISSANAADLGAGNYKDGSYVPVSSWSGFYVGVNGGYGWNSSDQTLTITDDKVTSTAVGQFTAPQSSGGFGGGQIGYNWQGAFLGPRVVLGLEADIQGAGIGGKNNVATTSLYNNNVASERNLDWFGTVRGRLGYAFDSTLLYATGGFAYGGVSNHFVSTNRGDGAYVTLGRQDTQTGFVAGGGIEQKISPSWSVKAEYQFIGLDSEGLTGTYVPSGHHVTLSDVDDQYHTVRLGLNYKFGPDNVSLK